MSTKFLQDNIKMGLKQHTSLGRVLDSCDCGPVEGSYGLGNETSGSIPSR